MYITEQAAMWQERENIVLIDVSCVKRVGTLSCGGMLSRIGIALQVLNPLG
jgi:hypothetical protein